MNIISILEDLEDEGHILKLKVSKNAPWYADLWKDDGSFYQIRFMGEERTNYWIDLNYYRANPQDNASIMGREALVGDWWNMRDPALRKLAAYRGSNMTWSYVLIDFRKRLLDRMKTEYYLKSICIPETMEGEIAESLRTRKIDFEIIHES